MSPGAGVDTGGCNITIMHNINTHILCVPILACTYLSVAMVACCCTGIITRIPGPRRVIRSRRWIAGIQGATCNFSTI